MFLNRDHITIIGSRIGDTAIDLAALYHLGYFKSIPLTDDIFLQYAINDFIADSRKTWQAVRNRISELFDVNNNLLKSNKKDKSCFL